MVKERIERISEINRRLALLNFVIFLSLMIIIFIEEYGRGYFLKISLTNLADRHHRHHKSSQNSQVNLITPQKSTSEWNLKFPANFLFGVASSAYQTEGALDEDGRTPSTWDTLIKTNPNQTDDLSTAETATNSYHLYSEDVKAIKQIGFKSYRISISWNRILPNGALVNQKAIEHYRRVIDEMTANGIEPIVTMFHWDLPQYIQDLGGLPNSIFVDYFLAYAEILYKNFGDKVKKWITFNEPFNYCVISYGYGVWAPAIKSPGLGDYLCIHNMLKAHAAAYHLFRDKYFMVHGGEVGIVMDSPYFIPTDSVSTRQHERAMQYRLGYPSNPIFSSTGGYPQVMVDEINNRSVSEGRPFSRLPEMSEEMKNFIRGSADFFGLNYYTSSLITVSEMTRDRNSQQHQQPSWSSDSGVNEFNDPLWKQSKAFWIYNVPQGLRELLKWIKKEYNNPKVLITENGWCDDGDMMDENRIEYFIDHLNAVALAINEDGCNVVGYIAWSLLDSFEWNAGFTYKYGLFSVDKNMKRSPKKSAKFWSEFLQTRNLQKSLKFFT